MVLMSVSLATLRARTWPEPYPDRKWQLGLEIRSVRWKLWTTLTCTANLQRASQWVWMTAANCPASRCEPTALHELSLPECTWIFSCRHTVKSKILTFYLDWQTIFLLIKILLSVCISGLSGSPCLCLSPSLSGIHGKPTSGPGIGSVWQWLLVAPCPFGCSDWFGSGSSNHHPVSGGCDPHVQVLVRQSVCLFSAEALIFSKQCLAAVGNRVCTF